MYEQIIFEIEDPVAVITMNRPEKLNPISDRMRAEIRHALAFAEAAQEVVGIVITGAGRGFSSGADMKELGAIQRAGAIEHGQPKVGVPPAHPGNPELGPDFQEGLANLLSIRKPIIAAINGACAGYGFSFAMYCDLRFLSDRAFLLPQFSKLGLVAEHGTSWILPRLLGPSRTLDILWSNRRIEPAEALELGLANRVVEHESLLEAAKGYVRNLAEVAAPFSLMQMKQMIYRHLMMPLGESMRDTSVLMDESVRRGEFKEGLEAFAERRDPVFPRVGSDAV